MHQEQNPDNHITIDSIREFRELTEIKLQSKQSGLLMIGGGVPKNFIQDTVVCAELLGKKVDMHKYAIQITVADTRDGACSSSTLKEASSWGKVDVTKEQMNDTGDLDRSAMADEAVCIGGRREDREERMDDQIGHHQAQRESARSSREREVA